MMTEPMANPAILLVEWLRTQFGEDERVARAVIYDNATGRWQVHPELPDTGYLHAAVVDESGLRLATGTDAFHEHAARHDPARVLRDVEAKRKILAVHWPTDFADSRVPGRILCVECSTMNRLQEWVGREYPCATVRLLALPYSDRPGYRPEWGER